MEFVNICSLPLLLVAQLIQFKHVFIPLVGWPCSFQGWLDPISAAPVLLFEWQLLTFQTSVNCRIQFRKHLVSTPVTRYPRHLYPCLSWGSPQLPDNLWLYLVGFSNSLTIHLFCHWVPVQDAFSVTHVQKVLSFKMSFKFSFAHCTNPHLSQPKHFPSFPVLLL